MSETIQMQAAQRFRGNVCFTGMPHEPKWHGPDDPVSFEVNGLVFGVCDNCACTFYIGKVTE